MPTDAELAAKLRDFAGAVAGDSGIAAEYVRLAAQRLEARGDTAFAEALAEIRTAIEGYYLALDRREHGEIAQHQAFEKIERILGMSWKG